MHALRFLLPSLSLPQPVGLPAVSLCAAGLLAVSLLAGCRSGGPADDSAGSDSADSVDSADTGPQPPALTALSNGECPDFSSPGSSKFMSHDEERKVIAYWPAARPEGMPVVFVWHPLGSSARDMSNWLDLEDYADQVGALVLVPDALASNPYEWDFWNDGEDDPTLYDDLRTCAAQEFDVNLKKVSSTGMSAGALWTTWLAIHRGDTLATVLPFSGGTEPVIQYSSPEGDFPVLLDYGGDTDQYTGGGGTVDFQQTTTAFASELYADGHEVVLCNHNLGHTLPPTSRQQMDAWLTAQTWGEPNSVEMSALPAYCEPYSGAR